MNKNNLLIACKSRALSVDEKEQLEQLLTQLLSPRKRLLKATLNTLVLLGFLLFVLLMLSGIVSYFAEQNLLLAAIYKLPYLQTFAVLISACYALFSSYRWINNMDNDYPLIVKDLKDDLVVDETYYVQDVCRFQEPEYGGFIYFLKISEQDVFVLYDYASQSSNGQTKDANDNPLAIGRSLTLSRAAQSRCYLNYHFGGEIVVITNSYAINLSPDKWPLGLSWCSYSWSQLHSEFSKK